MGTILTTVALQEQLSGNVLFTYTERSWTYSKDLHKLAGLLGSPAFFATLITMGSVFAVYRLTRARTFNAEVLYTLLAAYMAVGVFFTYNRAGYLGLAIDLVIMAVAWPRFRRLFVAAALVGSVAVLLSWSTVQQSAVVTERLQAKGPITYRLEIWGRAAQILMRNPIFGLGFFNFGPAYLRYNPAWVKGVVLPAPHNTVLEVTFNSGLIAGIPYVATILLIITSIVRFYRRARDDVDSGGEAALVLAFGLALLAYLVQSMVVDMVAAYYVNTVMMLALGALFGWQTERNYASRHPGPVSN